MSASASPAPDALPGRYRDARWLGRGTFGEVWSAVDDLGRPVAIKVMGEAAARSPESVWLFLGEFRRLARLSHPGFPAALEEGVTPAGLPFYSMALVEGPALADLPGPWPAALVRVRVGAIAAALAYLHGAGWVHGDLKPDNVRLTEAGDPLLLDLGQAAPIGQRRDGVAGTLAYLAPEALRLAPVGPSADLYALGVLAFEAWSGRLPYDGDPTSLVRAHLQAPVPALAGATPDADPVLAALITSLLAKDPAARPASAAAVAAALGRDVPAAGRGLLGGVLVGRGDVLTAWDAALAAREPEAARLALVGEAGLGRTRVLDELRPAAQLAGRTWVAARCAADGDAPAAPMRAVVRQALAAAGLAPEPTVAAWLAGRLTPALAELEPPARRITQHVAAGQALAAAAAALGGLAIGLDDWHRADAASLELMAFWRRTPPGGATPAGGGITWVATLDSEAAAVAFAAGPVALRPLDDAEAAALVAARLGAPAPAGLLAALAPAAAGRPQLLDLMLEHLVATSQLRGTHAGWAWAPDGAAELPDGLAGLWRARFGHLPPEARRLARAAALAAPAGALPAPVLAGPLGLADQSAALDALLAEGVVAGQDGRVRFALPGLAGVFTADLETGERESWTRAWVADLLPDLARSEIFLTAPCDLAPPFLAPPFSAPPSSAPPSSAPPFSAPPSSAPPSADILAQAARLAVAAPLPDLIYRLAGAAGRQAMALGAPADALPLLAAAAAYLPPAASPADQLAIIGPLAEAHRWTDQLTKAADGYEQAIALAHAASDPRAEAIHRIDLAKVRQMHGRVPDAEALLREADALAAAAGDAGTQARVAASLARIKLFAGRPDEGIALAATAADLARAAGRRNVLGQALNLQGYILAQREPGRVAEALALLDEALAIARTSQDRVSEGMALDNLGNTYLAVGDLRGAEAAFRANADLCRANGTLTEATFADLNLAIALAELGELPEAAALAADVVRRADLAGRKYVRGAARAVEAQARARAGDLYAAGTLLDAALEDAAAIANAMLEEHVRGHRLEAAVAAGDASAAQAEATHLARLIAETAHAEAAARLDVHRATLALRTGDLPGAIALADPHSLAPSRVAAHHARQVLAATALRAGDPLSATAHAEAARGIARAWRAPWHEAADVLLLARACAAEGDASAAQDLAWEALELGTGNPWVQAGAAVLLADPQALAAARRTWRPHLTALGPVRAAQLLNAHGLSALAAAEPANGPALDLDAWAAALEALALPGDEADLAQAALAAAMGLIGAERGYVLAYDHGQLRQAVTAGLDYDAEVAQGFSASIAERVLFTGSPLYVADAGADPELRTTASVVNLKLTTVVCLPLAVPDRILGVIYLDRTAIEPMLAPPDLVLLASLATATAGAILRAREAEAARRAHDTAQACLALGLAARQLNDDALRQAALEACRQATGAARAYWLRASAQAAGWTAIAHAGPPFDPAAISRGLVDWAVAHVRPLALHDASGAEGSVARESLAQLGLRTVWCLPLAGGGAAYLDAPHQTEVDPTPALDAAAALLAYAQALLGEA